MLIQVIPLLMDVIIVERIVILGDNYGIRGTAMVVIALLLRAIIQHIALLAAPPILRIIVQKVNAAVIMDTAPRLIKKLVSKYQKMLIAL